MASVCFYSSVKLCSAQKFMIGYNINPFSPLYNIIHNIVRNSHSLGEPLFGGVTPGNPSRLNLGCQCFLITMDIYQTNILTEFEGATPLGKPFPQMDQDLPNINFLNSLTLSASVFLISVDI